MTTPVNEFGFMGYEQFLLEYPEFAQSHGGASTNVKLVQLKLQVAQQLIDPAVWGNKTYFAHGLKTAEILGLSVFGKNAKMPGKEGTTYGAMFKALVKQVTGKARPII